MGKYQLALRASLLAAAALVSPTMSQADVIGAAYQNNAASGNALIGFSHGAADATFSVPSPTNAACSGIFAGDTLCFNSGAVNGYTLGGFLATGGATILTGSAAALASNLNNTVFEFTGTVTVTTGETFQAGHDDGLQLMIGSILVINAPGPTGFTTTPATYTGPSGTFGFDLVYGECCGPPALLGISLPLVSTPPPPSVPEPGTLALLSAGLIGLGTIRSRKRG
jgi:PEP-CTERM motif